MINIINHICVCIAALSLITSSSALKADDIPSSASPSFESINKIDVNENEIDLFNWARHHGAKIADSIEIKNSPCGGRGLYAKRFIPVNTELIQIPYNLQLGARQLADGTDVEMQTMARSLPWRYVMENELFFVPLSIALAAERRKGTDSIFWPFLQSLPNNCVNAASGSSIDDVLSDLHIWAPHVAKKIIQRRLSLQTLHDTICPKSLSIEEIRWATANVCSRSLIRKRIKELSSEQVNKIGIFCSSDHSRMLPIIDLVNHGSCELANVWVGHLSRDEDDTNDFSTSLKSIRDILPGEELLFDYGGGNGKKISNDRLLLDYGFVLRDHMDHVSITLEEFSTAIEEIIGRDTLKDAPATDTERLHSLVTTLIKQASKLQSDIPVVFTSNGEPTIPTLAIAVCMTCHDIDDLSSLLKVIPMTENQNQDLSLLSNQIIEACSVMQKEFARYVLKVASGFAIAQRSGMTESDSIDEFTVVCRKYSKFCRDMLLTVADMTR